MSVIPADPRPALWAAYDQLAKLSQVERDLETAEGIWRGTDLGRAAGWRHDLSADRQQFQKALRPSDIRWRERRRLSATIKRESADERAAVVHFEQLASAVRVQLKEERRSLEAAVDTLQTRVAERNEWFSQHPEAEHRLGLLNAELSDTERATATHPRLEGALRAQLEQALGVEPLVPAVEADRGLDLGL